MLTSLPTTHPLLLLKMPLKLQTFEDISSDADDSGSLLCALAALLRGATPRCILCCGFCVGGTLATLAAAWVALRWPDADVRWGWGEGVGWAGGSAG